MIYGHKNTKQTIQTDAVTFQRLITDGALVADDWMECPPRPQPRPGLDNPPYWDAGQWVVVPMTPEQIQAATAAAAEQASLDTETRQAREVISDLLAGAGTAAQRLTRLERVAVFMIRRLILN